MPVREDQLVEQLMPDFFHMQNPGAAWMHAISAHLAIPGIRGLWPLSGVGVSGEALDISGLGNHLTLRGNPQFSYDNLAPICIYDGIGDYHDITDIISSNAFDIPGTSVFVQNAVRGMTWGIWCYPQEMGTDEIVFGKWGGAGARSYRLYLDNANQFNAVISDDGTNVDTATSAAISMNAWYHVVCRFDISTTVDIFVNNVEINQATARASVFNSVSDLAIGARGDGGLPFEGRLSLAWISCMYLSNDIISALYRFIAPMYGIRV